MGFQNPPIPWRELERRLSGRSDGRSAEPRPGDPHFDDVPGDGGDSPAWSRKREAYIPGPERLAPEPNRTPYAELHAHSSFSFLDGASSPEEMAEEAVRLGLQGLALTDHDGVYGIVRYAEAADALGLPTIFGAELSLDVEIPRTQSERMIAARAGIPDPPGRHLLVLARDPIGYASLCRTMSAAHRRGGVKGRPVYDLEELTADADGHWLILTGCRKGSVRGALESPSRYGTFALDPARAALDELVARFGRESVVVELTHSLDPLADDRYDALALLAEEARLPMIASTAAHYHAPVRRPLATAMAAVRARSTLDDMDGWLPGWSDQHLRSGDEMAARFSRWRNCGLSGSAAGASLTDTATGLATELAFKLKLIAPELPPFPVPAGHNEMTYLRELALNGAEQRYGARSAETEPAYQQIEHELRIINQLNFPGYFLVVWGITQFCHSRGILCQGRGSAANSAVCFAIGITAVDPVRYGLLFERFLSPDRDGPPDIDVDIESDRREEAIQFVYQRYDRDHAAQVANVISYRPKSALRDVAKALGYSAGQQDAWSKEIDLSYYWTPDTFATVESSPESQSQSESQSKSQSESESESQSEAQVPQRVLDLAVELQNAPRHLGIHSGGMVICDRPIVEVCPVEWGRMPNRTVLQWDKDDCASIGLVKFDLLGLGMLSALKYCFDFVEEFHGKRYGLHEVPAEDPLVYDMLCEADTVGVFQIESRAQMGTLPRLRPREFYDLVIEIALIRPGPIQGESVHPYIRRRKGLEEITYPHPKLKKHLKKTLGIPLFQEQLMQLAIDAAGCSPSEADAVRRAMGSKRSHEKMEALRQRLYDGMAANGIVGEVADGIFTKIKAFAAFGFAESHSISFAFLVYASSWLKLYHPAAFCASLLNAQPMGFYSPQSLVHDAKRHGVTVLGPSINISLAAANLEWLPASDANLLHSEGHGAHSAGGFAEAPYSGPGPVQPAVRLGLSSVRSISDAHAERIVAERESNGPFTSMGDLARRVGLSTDQVEALATAGAFTSFEIGRRDALWIAGAVSSSRPGQLDVRTFDETSVPDLPAMTEPEQLMADLWATGISREHYPTALIRPRLDALGVIPSAQLKRISNGTRVIIGGIVTHRQRPATARGVTFINLEDETGMVNVICDPIVWTRYRKVARMSGGLLIRGMLERADGVTNVSAERIERLPLGLRSTSRDFR
ncbi:DnaE-like error-prone DNA polymerase [Jatrophihabitans sp. GAS493]|uniref:error-prone DNA polymerase n=1 Tax=Jatrophihabitans sp. GAS493 TaxID=1907575 RepID=UPI000BB80D9C|nr:error-prone DNA polymerase [Jatrophihabitans sp. GAS493]SOD74762.1 DnaE-like error-prone DNA polymerase [Jatrophihabitans sp. GAS493]